MILMEMIAYYTFIVLLHLSTASYNTLHAPCASQSLEFGSIFPLKKNIFTPNLVIQNYVFSRHGGGKVFGGGGGGHGIGGGIFVFVSALLKYF